MDWFLERLQQSDPTLDYQDLFNHKTDFKKLVDLKIIKHLHNVEILMCEWCDNPHSVSLFRNKNNEIVLSCSGSRRVVDPDELKVWTINRDTLLENVKTKNRVVDKSAFEKTTFASPNISGKANEECYITKNSNGDYLFEGNNVYIKNKSANYAVIFDVAYSLKPQGGKIEYKKIIEQCKKRKKKIKQKSILRALTGNDANLFKYVKGLKQEPKYGISLFVAMQDGKEIEFNNKK